MENSTPLSLETNQSSIQGYSTPPRSKIPPPSTSPLSFSELFHQSKILTSNELKSRFSPIKTSMKKRRYNLIRKNDSIVPIEQNLNMPVILKKLFDYPDHLPTNSMNDEDCLVPISSHSLQMIHSQSIFDNFISNSYKTKQENLFSISETTMKQKFHALLQKN